MGPGTPPRLILLNGPPGVGKSTLARRYADAHPPTLALEIDAVRAMLGDWLADAARSGPAARDLALAMARTHLAQGHDVIVPQLLTRRPFVERLRGTAEAAGASFCEVTLMDARDAVLARAYAREEPRGGFSARALSARQGSTLEDAYDRFLEALQERADAIMIDASSPENAYAELQRLVGSNS